MKNIGILFKAEMVLAILRPTNYKTETRRLVTRPKWADPDSPIELQGGFPFVKDRENGTSCLIACPYGTAGDALWGRETWQHSNHPYGPYDANCSVFYRADYLDDVHGPDGEKSPEGRYRWWNPAIHMPKTAGRLSLVNTGVRASHLQTITAAGCLAEGVEALDRHPITGEPGEWYRIRDLIDTNPRVVYAAYIDRINGTDTWASNPLVWTIQFDKAAQ